MNRFRWVATGSLWLAAVSPSLAADITVSSGQSINAALATALSGDRVLVETGSYYESVALTDGVQLLGGYDAAFADSTRDPLGNPTMIHGSDVSPAVTSGPVIGSGTIIDGFRLSGGGGTPGACVLVDGGAPVFSNNRITGNHHNGITGGVYIFGGSTARFADNEISDNTTASSGGGMRIEQSAPEIVRNLFDSCLAPTQGGGLYAVETAMACSSNVFRDCRARDGGGGGAHIQYCGSDAILVDTVFENCDAPYGGGVMVKDECSPYFEEVLFDGCSATQAGGGVAILGNDFVGPTFVDARFVDCTSGYAGGGLFADGSDFNLLGSDATSETSGAAFVRCLSSLSGARPGGGIAAYGSRATIDQVRFTECRSDSMGGGGFFFQSEITASLCIIERCQANDGGGFVFATDTPSVADSPASWVLSCTFHECEGTAGSGRPGGALTVAAVGTINIANIGGCIISNTISGAGIRCRKGSGGVGTGRPEIECSSFHSVDGNSATIISGDECSISFNTGADNLNSDDHGYVPEFCEVFPVTYSIKDCSPDFGSTCSLGVVDAISRGANQTLPCAQACGVILSIESGSWGQIKAMYR